MVRRPKDAHRSKSKATPGYDRDLLRDDEDLLGPSESRPATQEDVDEHFGTQRWEPSEPYEPPESFAEAMAKALVQGVMDGLVEIVRSPEVQAAVIEAWRERKAKRLERREGRRQKRAVFQVTSSEQQADSGATDEPRNAVEVTLPPSEGVSAEHYAELLRMRLMAQAVLERTESRLCAVHVEDRDRLAPELREAYRAALESDLRDLDPNTLELLGFTPDGMTSEGVTKLVGRGQPPELPN